MNSCGLTWFVFTVCTSRAKRISKDGMPNISCGNDEFWNLDFRISQGLLISTLSDRRTRQRTSTFRCRWDQLRGPSVVVDHCLMEFVWGPLASGMRQSTSASKAAVRWMGHRLWEVAFAVEYLIIFFGKWGWVPANFMRFVCWHILWEARVPFGGYETTLYHLHSIR